MNLFLKKAGATLPGLDLPCTMIHLYIWLPNTCSRPAPHCHQFLEKSTVPPIPPTVRVSTSISVGVMGHQAAPIFYLQPIGHDAKITSASSPPTSELHGLKLTETNSPIRRVPAINNLVSLTYPAAVTPAQIETEGSVTGEISGAAGHSVLPAH